jgi:phage shock protein A
MTSLFRKINTLVRAQIDSFLEDDLRIPRGRRDEPIPDPLSKEAQQEIVTLRQEIDEALNYEDRLQEQVDALHQDASDLDAQVNQALQANDDATAKQLLAALRRAEQKIEMLNAGLEKHRKHTSILMDEVNMLEGMVADARAQQNQPPAAAAPESPPEPTVSVPVTIHEDTTAKPITEAPPAPPPQPTINVRVQDASQTTDDDAQPAPPSPTQKPDAPATPQDNDEQELAARRDRLSRQEPNKEE